MNNPLEIARLNAPKKQWNPVYKRFECPRCGEQWNIGFNHASVCSWYQSLVNEAVQS